MCQNSPYPVKRYRDRFQVVTKAQNSITTENILKLATDKKTVALLASAIVAGIFFSLLHVPVGWLLGSMLVGIIYAINQGSPQPLPPAFRSVGQVIVGLVTAIRFSPENLSVATSYPIPMLLCVCTTGSLSMLNGLQIGGKGNGCPL